MTAQEMWEAYTDNKELTYLAWQYGAAADKLADLTLKGIKQATASAFDLYGEEPVPQVGDFSVILNSQDEAVCIIKTTTITLTKFKDVSAEFARKEGEGDFSLDYWREVHETFFTSEFASVNKPFDVEMRVVCEEFEVVYPK